jgi:hypothetical protein
MNLWVETDPRVISELLDKQPWEKPKWVGEVSHGSSFMIQSSPPERMDEEFPLHIWEMPEYGESYTVAVDPSSGRKNGDPAAIQVVSSFGRQVAEVLLKNVELPAQLQTSIWISYFYNYAMLVIEINGFAAMAGKYVEDMGYKNIWHDSAIKPGFMTTEKRSNMLINRFHSSLKMESPFLRSKRLLSELKSYTENGPSQDDLTSAMLIAHGIHGSR